MSGSDDPATDPPIVTTIRTGTNTIHAARPHMMTDAATVNTSPSRGASTPRRYPNQSMTAAEPSTTVISQAGLSNEWPPINVAMTPWAGQPSCAGQVGGLVTCAVENSGSGVSCRRRQHVVLHAFRFGWLGGGGAAL